MAERQIARLRCRTRELSLASAAALLKSYFGVEASCEVSIVDAVSIERGFEASDEAILSTWLQEHLLLHLRWWSDACGLGYSTDALDVHVQKRLLPCHLEELRQARGDSRRLVAVARRERVPVAVVHAEVGEDPFLPVQSGRLSWVFVAMRERRRGTASTLLTFAHRWMLEQGCAMREVFVTSPNEAGLRLYRSTGYALCDLRMLAPARGSAFELQYGGPGLLGAEDIPSYKDQGTV